MIKVYQTISDKGKGDCMQASIASLFELEMNQVPEFVKLKDGWYNALHELSKSLGYNVRGTLYNVVYNKYRYPNETFSSECRIGELKEMKGVKGYFWASVLSPKFYYEQEACPTTHAVIIDKDCNIVHDPYYPLGTKYPLTDIIGFNGVIYVTMIEPI